ncbi:MAG: vWA domain-containing protein [Candidatus Woesearchaeota archaeon]
MKSPERQQPQNIEKPEKLDGNLAQDASDHDKLASTILEDDGKTMHQADLVNEMMNHGSSHFVPNLFFEQLVSNFQQTKQMYGERFLRQLSDTSSEQLERNLRFPEYKKEIKEKIEQYAKGMQQAGMVDNKGQFTDQAYMYAGMTLALQELDKLQAQGFSGEYMHKQKGIHGEQTDVKPFTKQRYKDIALRQAIRLAMKRAHTTIHKQDLQVAIKEQKGKIQIIYALDVSGSMKGKKLLMAKRAGIALAHKAIQDNNRVGFIAFSDVVHTSVRPTRTFMHILQSIARVKAQKQTNVHTSIEHALTLFDNNKETKHLILLTDALPTVGDDPHKQAIHSVSQAVSAGITISLVGIDVEDKTFAQQLAHMGRGTTHFLESSEQLDQVLLNEYDRIRL